MSRADSHVLEEESRRAFINLLPSAWVHRDEVPDYHIDMEVVIADRGKVTNEVFWVQLKATENIRHSGGVVPYSIKTEHLKYYENCRLPVVILLWVKPENTFYYLFAQHYIREKLSKEDPDWRAKITKTIEFRADSRLKDANSLKEIATDGYLYIIEQEPSVGSKAGVVPSWLDGIPKSDDAVLKEHTVKALLCMRNEDYNGAITEYKYILRVVCKTPSTEKMAILLNLGIAYHWLGQNVEALDNCSAVLELAKGVTEKDALPGKAAALGNIGLIYKDRGDLKTALKCHQATLKIDREIGNRHGEATALGNIGLIYVETGDLNEAIKYFENSLRIDREIGYRQGEANGLANIGLVYFARGDLSEAIKYHESALKIDREIGYRQGEANDLVSIGLIYKNRGDLNEALKYYESALRIDREIGYRQGEASSLANIGNIYNLRGDLNEALKYYESALRIDREIGNRQGEANDLACIGLAYFAKGDVDKALIRLLGALDLLDKHGLAHGRDIVQNAISSINQKQKLQC